MTAGTINKTVVSNGGLEVPQPMSSPSATTHSIGFYPSTPLGRYSLGKNKPNLDVYGNQSRLANNWIGGPKHEVCMQHIPGYRGHIPNVTSENIFSKTYAKCTRISIGQTNHKGHDLPPKYRFKTTAQTEFRPKNFRRLSKLTAYSYSL